EQPVDGVLGQTSDEVANAVRGLEFVDGCHAASILRPVGGVEAGAPSSLQCQGRNRASSRCRRPALENTLSVDTDTDTDTDTDEGGTGRTMLFSEEFVAGRVNAREAAGQVRER